ncbi:flagellar biosynthesis protein FlhF [Maribrevibacterium harenarium]
MRKAIRKVRDAVGPDAVILSNQRLPSGEIEITTAIDYDGSLPNKSPSYERPVAPRSSNQQASSPQPAPRQQPPVRPSEDYQERIERARAKSEQQSYETNAQPTQHNLVNELNHAAQRFELEEQGNIEEALSVKRPVVPSPEEEKIRAMEQELNAVKRLLEQTQQQTVAPAAVKIPAPPSESPRQILAQRLKYLGLSDGVIEKICSNMSLTGREEDWKRALSNLADYIPIRSAAETLQGCIAFMGPTGVGKTTSIGKIAAQYVLKYGAGSVVLVTTDTYRIAAHEQLRTFGRILNVPVEVVNEYSDLNEVLDKYANYSLILVDTAGMNPRDRNLERQLLMMKRARGYLKKLLVLPCTSQHQVLKTVVDVYSQVQLDGCVLSKLDESASLGEAISVVIEEALPVMYIADGQRIPDDIEPARAHHLISRAVYIADQYGQLYGSLKYGS